MEKQRYLEAGQIVNTHGIRGEVKIVPWVDSAEFLKKFKTLYINEKPVKVISSRIHKTFLIAMLEGVEDVNAAMTLKNKKVYIDRKDAKLPKGRFFNADIMGARVVTDEGTDIGEVADVMEMPAQNILLVKGEREIMIPMVDDFILDIDLKKDIITVHLIEGL